MDKPSWEDAPDNAMWIARDEDGTWNWFATEPIRFKANWVVTGSTVIKKKPTPIKFEMVKEKRPEEAQ